MIRLGMVFFISWVLAAGILAVTDLEHPRVRVDRRAIPDEFPLLVVGHREGAKTERAGIVFHSNYEYYSDDLSTPSTLLIPRDRVAMFNRQVGESGQQYPCVPGRFEVEHMRDGRQRLKVTGTWRSGFNHEIGWYVADCRGFTPEYYQSKVVGIPGVFVAVAHGLVAAVGVCAIAIFGSLLHRMARRIFAGVMQAGS